MILGAWEIVVVAMAALLFLGPEKMPELARKLARLVSQAQGLMGEIRRSVGEALHEDEPHRPHVHEPANRSVQEGDAAFSDWAQRQAPPATPPEPVDANGEAPADESTKGHP